MLNWNGFSIDWVAIVITIIGAGANILILWLNNNIKSKIETDHAKVLEDYKKINTKELEDFRHDLETITKLAERDFVIRNQDFNLWTQKRHEAYSKLYSALTKAHSSLYQLGGSGFVEVYNFDRMNENELRNWVLNNNLPENKCTELIRLIDVNKDEAISQIKKDERQINNADREYRELNNLYVLSIIYLSPETDKMVHNYNKMLGKQVRNYIYNHDFDITPDGMYELDTNLKNKRLEIAELMRKELSGGYSYKPNEVKEANRKKDDK